MGVKSVAFRIGTCFRAACKHPFLMIMLCLLAVVYRSFPYLFSLLVSASPIIFCTGVLLGALLSFSQKKAAPPQIRGQEETLHFKTQISNNVSVKETSKPVGSIEEDSSEDDDTERSQQGFELLNGDGLVPKLLSSEVEIHKSGSCDSKLPKHKDDDEERSDESGSSASPDAEIVPMLDDELHPLLDEDAPPGPPVDGVSCEHFCRSNDSSEEEKTELQVEDEEEEDEEEGDKEELTKSAIKWTEEDEKNMMEVRSSELERNQLLESVMARRRSRKWVSMSMMGSESWGPPFVITRPRHNPFDSLPDSYEEGLPPIPGSAPSILIPRQNPFDIPYYEQDKTGDNHSGLDFLDFQPKETTTTTTTLFEGSEFLNVVPSIFGKPDESYFAAELSSNGGGKEIESVSDREDLEDKNVIKDEEEEKVDVRDREEKKVIDDEHMFEKAVLITKIEQASEDVGHGSQSSEEEEDEEELGSRLRNIFVDEIVMRPEKHGEFKSELESVERIFIEKEEKTGASVEERRSSSSSSSSSSSGCDAENGISGQAAVELSMEEGGERREPVYDSSPPRNHAPIHQSLRRNLSSSSLDVGHESWFPPRQVKRTVSFGLPPIQIKRTVSFAEGVIMMGSSSHRVTGMPIPITKDMLGSSTISQSQPKTTSEVVPNHQHQLSNSFPDTSNSHSQGDMKHLQDQQMKKHKIDR